MSELYELLKIEYQSILLVGKDYGFTSQNWFLWELKISCWDVSSIRLVDYTPTENRRLTIYPIDIG